MTFLLGACFSLKVVVMGKNHCFLQGEFAILKRQGGNVLYSRACCGGVIGDRDGEDDEKEIDNDCHRFVALCCIICAWTSKSVGAGTCQAACTFSADTSKAAFFRGIF